MKKSSGPLLDCELSVKVVASVHRSHRANGLGTFISLGIENGVLLRADIGIKLMVLRFDMSLIHVVFTIAHLRMYKTDDRVFQLLFVQFRVGTLFSNCGSGSLSSDHFQPKILNH